MLARPTFAAALLVAVASAPVLHAQDAAAQDAAVQNAPAQAPKHIHIVGASVSGGFEDGPLFGAKTNGDSVAMLHMLKKWADGEVKVTSHPKMEMWYLFSNPLKIGRKQIDLAKKKQPDMVVAVDFLFWFSYGYMSGSDKQKARLERLEQGIEMLKELNVPIVIGDLPNMKGAKIRMLKPRQIPTEESLKLLNARLKKFADEDKNVTLVPMAKIVKALKVDGVELPLKAGGVKTGPGALLQEDQLHATRLGMALLSYQLQDTLRAHFPKAHVLHKQQWTFDEFVDAAGADIELENLIEGANKK